MGEFYKRIKEKDNKFKTTIDKNMKIWKERLNYLTRAIKIKYRSTNHQQKSPVFGGDPAKKINQKMHIIGGRARVEREKVQEMEETHFGDNMEEKK